jgi:hypothetical protein
MDPVRPVADPGAVVALDDQGPLACEAHHRGGRRPQPDQRGRAHRQVLVEVLVRQRGDRRFDDVGRPQRAGRHGPTAGPVVQGELGLRAGQRELAGCGPDARSRGVGREPGEPVGDVLLGQRLQCARAGDLVDPVGPGELRGSGHIPTEVLE